MSPSPNQPRELISTEKLEARIAEMAAQIEADYRDQDPPLCIGVLKGTVFFMVDLLKRINLPLQVDFLQTSSYGSGTQAGEVRILKDVEIAIRGRNVLLIEDIVDTGFTLNTVLALLRFRGARSVKLAAMLDKRAARQIEVDIDYCGFEIDDVFVIGYGLDVDERYRNLPYIGVFEGE